jgi:inositol phosphorylceramide mannosyltransferase catalytic subunit
MRIPKIIHQTWKTKNIPDPWRECVSSWKRYNPEWQYVLWTDLDNRNFIKANYSADLKMYDNYSFNIQRADAVRYFILHKHGGVYADIDIECLQPIESLLSEYSFVACYEPQKHGKWFGLTSMISNAFMAAAPNHPFLEKVLTVLATKNPKINLHEEVLKTTGPIMLNEVLEEYGQADVTLLEDYVMNPLTGDSEEIDDLMNNWGDHLKMKESFRTSGTYGIHYWANSWVKNLAGPLENPDPFNVRGYIFHPGMDSIGNDIGNVGRNIGKLVKECNRNSMAVAFNTDGFLKYRLQPKSKWSHIDNIKGNEGSLCEGRIPAHSEISLEQEEIV